MSDPRIPVMQEILGGSPAEAREALAKIDAVKMPRKRWRFVPDDWEPTDAHRDKARKLNVDLNLALDQFRNHEFAQPKSDANRAFSNWLSRMPQFKGPGQITAKEERARERTVVLRYSDRQAEAARDEAKRIRDEEAEAFEWLSEQDKATKSAVEERANESLRQSAIPERARNERMKRAFVVAAVRELRGET